MPVAHQQPIGTDPELFARSLWEPNGNWSVLEDLDTDQCGQLLKSLSNPRKDDVNRHRLAAAARCAWMLSPEKQGELKPLIGKIAREVLTFWWRSLDSSELNTAFTGTGRPDRMVEHITPLISQIASARWPVAVADLFLPPETRQVPGANVLLGFSLPRQSSLNAALEVVLRRSSHLLATLPTEIGRPGQAVTFDRRDSVGRYGPMELLRRVCFTFSVLQEQASGQRAALSIFNDLIERDTERGGLPCVAYALTLWPDEPRSPLAASRIDEFKAMRLGTGSMPPDQSGHHTSRSVARENSVSLADRLREDPSDRTASTYLRGCMSLELSPSEVLPSVAVAVRSPQLTADGRLDLLRGIMLMHGDVDSETADELVTSLRVLSDQVDQQQVIERLFRLFADGGPGFSTKASRGLFEALDNGSETLAVSARLTSARLVLTRLRSRKDGSSVPTTPEVAEELGAILKHARFPAGVLSNLIDESRIRLGQLQEVGVRVFSVGRTWSWAWNYELAEGVSPRPV